MAEGERAGGVTRREFLRGTGIAAAGAVAGSAGLGAVGVAAAAAGEGPAEGGPAAAPAVLGPGRVPVRLRVNGIERLAVIGKRAARQDGRAKVTGAARYTADVRLAGMLHARVIRAPLPHARIRSIDTAAAEAHPAVRAVHVVDRVRGIARMRDGGDPERPYPIVRFAGQPVAAVAALTPADAEEAARLVKVDYEPLPFVVDPEKARRPGAPLVFPAPAEQKGTAGGGGGPSGVPQEGNVRGPVRAGFFGPPAGDVEKGLAEADVVVEGEFRTQVQTHSTLETHGVVADWRGDGRDASLTVHASTQGTSSVRDDLAAAFSLPLARVRVVTEFMGGGFGSKFGAGNYGLIAAHLSRKAGAPVRLMRSRRSPATGRARSSA